MSQQQEYALESSATWAEQTGEQGWVVAHSTEQFTSPRSVWLRGPQVHYKSNKCI